MHGAVAYFALVERAELRSTNRDAVRCGWTLRVRSVTDTLLSGVARRSLDFDGLRQRLRRDRHGPPLCPVGKTWRDST